MMWVAVILEIIGVAPEGCEVVIVSETLVMVALALGAKNKPIKIRNNDINNALFINLRS